MSKIGSRKSAKRYIIRELVKATRNMKNESALPTDIYTRTLLQVLGITPYTEGDPCIYTFKASPHWPRPWSAIRHIGPHTTGRNDVTYTIIAENNQVVATHIREETKTALENISKNYDPADDDLKGEA